MEDIKDVILIEIWKYDYLVDLVFHGNHDSNNLLGTKWANTLFSEIKHSFALFLKLNREMPLFCNSTIEKSSFNE